MAVNIDFSQIEDSAKSDAPRTQLKSGNSSLDDAFIDVTADIEPPRTRARLLISPRDQLSLVSVFVILSAAFLWRHFISDRFANQPQRLAAYQVELNTADLEELVLLEGIGEVTAEKIILDRELNGRFLTEDQLQRVKGIGPKTMERLRDHIVCR